MAKELVEELIYAKQLAGEDLWRLNEAIFNVPEDDVIKHQLSSRLFQLVTRIRKEYQAGHFYARDQGDYLALLGTLQNQPFSARQSATLRQWIAEALGAGKDDFGAQDRPARADLKKLQRLTETNQVLAEELQKLKKLEKAVRIFASFQMPSGLARSREKVEPAKAANKETPEQSHQGGTVDAITEALKKAGKEKAKAQEAPGYQVHTDIGWRRYDEDAQNVIQNACTKGREECEIFAQGQYYKINLKRMVQINPGTGNEREIRLHGQRPVAPEMPKLNFKRLMVEFKQLEAQIADGSCEGFLLRCEPVEDNLMEWEVDMSFPSDSPLQKSLDNLAAIMFDSTLKRLTLCVRFTVEFPLSPPEVWLRRPRMRYPSGQTGPVTFGGRVCSLLLASAGWQPATSMLSVFKEVQQSLLASEIEANTMVHIKKEYPKASVQLERLNTELFHTVNGFCKDGMTALSPEAAQPFLGDLKRLEVTDKIGLPLSYANGIYQRAELGAELVLPMIFEIKTLLGRKTHCAIFEFFDGLPDMHVLIPKWVMEDLAIHEREPVRVRGVELDLVTSVKVQPHSVDFYSAVRDSQRDVKELLTESLSRFSTLTEDTAVPIEVNEKFFQVQVISVEPHGAVRIIDMDVQHHFEFKVEFEPAPDLEDENATKEYQDRVLNSIKLRRERSAAGRQEIEQRRSEARRKRYEDLLQKFRGGQGEGGQIEIALRMPDGSQVKGKFVEGSPVSSLVAFALESSWAKMALPWGVYLRRAFPKQVLKEDEAITKEFHRSALSIQEEQAPEKDEELFAVLRASSPQRRKPPEGAEPEALAPLPVPERDEATLMSRTQRAFEMQRFLRAGFSLEEAEEKFQAGEEVEFFDRPLTPSFRPEMLISDDEKVPPIPSALLEQQGCSKQYKSTGKLLGKGNWGTVYEVEEQGSKCRFWRRCQKKRFALKMVSASSQQGKAVMEHEAQVMLAANQHSCSHVIPMITPAPCVDGKQQHYSFVTTLLPYDLFKWRNQQTSRVKLQHCYPVVAKAVYDGLKCLHASGYIHGDLKDDNILFKEFDADGCPSGIVLGDLGLARKIGSSIYKFHASNYAGSCHLVASLFDGQSDPLGINTMVRVQGTYVNAAIVQAKIDYCSWAMMVTYFFGLPEDKDLTKMLGKGSCGPMGPGRRKLYP